MAIEVNPLPDGFAAEVVGADMNHWQDDAPFETIHGAFLNHGVIVVRDQTLTPDAQIAFGRRLGELHGHVLEKFLLPGHPKFLVLSNRLKNGEPIGVADAGRHWHSDMSYTQRPPLGSMLYALEIPPVGGDTLFVDMQAVYEALPTDTKRRIDGLKGVYNYVRDYEKARKRNPNRPRSARNNWRPCLKSRIRWCEPIPIPDARRFTSMKVTRSASTAWRRRRAKRC